MNERSCQKCEDRAARPESELCGYCASQGWAWWYDAEPDEEPDMSPYWPTLPETRTNLRWEYQSRLSEEAFRRVHFELFRAEWRVALDRQRWQNRAQMEAIVE